MAWNRAKLLARFDTRRDAQADVLKPPTQVILVTGSGAMQRENAIAAALPQLQPTAGTIALILEGLPAGICPLDAFAADHVHIARIAPGCVCCIGSLTLKVTLNRILRHSPSHLFLAIASTDHLGRLRAFLATPPYATLVQLAQELHA